MQGFSELLEAAKRGERDALAKLHERYAPAVLASVRAGLSPLLRRHYDSLDLRQSVFEDVLRDLPRFEDRGEQAFRSWVRIKAENKLRSKLRKHLGVGGRQRQRRLDTDAASSLTSAASSPDVEVVSTDEQRRLRLLIQELDAVDRDVVAMRAESGAAFGEIARSLGLPSADSARKRYVRALVRLRERLDHGS